MCLVYPATHTVRHQVWICWHWCLVYVTSNWNRRKVWNRIGNKGQQNKREHLVVIDTCFHGVELSIRSNGGYWNEVDVLIDPDINCYALSHCFTRLDNWESQFFWCRTLLGQDALPIPWNERRIDRLATPFYILALWCADPFRWSRPKRKHEKHFFFVLNCETSPAYKQFAEILKRGNTRDVGFSQSPSKNAMSEVKM